MRPRAPRAPASPRVLGGLVLASVVTQACLYAQLYASRGFLADDAYICFRYARRWAEGLGLTWNDGMWVEGFSNPLWTLTLGAVARIGAEPHVSALWLGLGFLLCVPLALGLLAARLGLGAVAAAVLLLGLGLDVNLMLWSGSGLETAQTTLLYALWLALAASRQRSQGSFALLGLLTGLLLLARPEAPLWALAMAVWWIARERAPWRSLALWGGVALAPPLAYLVFRWMHYGRLLPNTFHAKAESTLYGLLNATGNLLGWSLAHAVPLAIVVVALLSARAGGRRLRADQASLSVLAVLCLGAQACFVLAVGGDYLGHGRFLAPLLPGFYLATALVVSRLPRIGSGRSAALLLAALLPLHVAVGYASVDHLGDFVPAGRELGVWLERNARPSDRLAIAAAGVVPYFSRLWTYDVLGLNDPDVVEHELHAARAWAAGHNRYDLDRTFELRPDWIVWGLATEYNARRMEQLGVVTRNRERLGLWDAFLSHPALHEQYRLERAVPEDVQAFFAVFRRRDGSD